MKVEIFEGSRLKRLQAKINKWVEPEMIDGVQVEPCKQIKIVSQSQCLDSAGNVWITISVWYEIAE